MVLQAPPGSPLWLTAAADSLLALHIIGGTLGIGAGALAFAAPKGGAVHRLAGQVYAPSMLAMGAIGAGVAAKVGPPSNVAAGLLVIYLVASGWATLKRGAELSGLFEIGAMLFALVIAAYSALFGLLSLKTSSDAGAMFVFVAVILFAAGFDLAMIWRGGLVGAARLRRHLWRMGSALLLAAVSLFLGQQQVFPEPLRSSGLLFLPPLAVLFATLAWAISPRMGFARPRRPRERGVAPAAGQPA
ncbi:MAG: hypothetical protein ACREEH_05090 [Caulobacteraceae bacterium]